LKDAAGSGQKHAEADDAGDASDYSASSQSSERPLKKRAGGFDVAEPSTSITDTYRAEAAAVATGKPVSVMMPAVDGSWSFVTSSAPTSSMMKSEKKYCMRFFVGQCFDPGCLFVHASSVEKQEGFAKFVNVPCKFGSRCHNVTCMYQHPGVNQISGLADNPVRGAPAQGRLPGATAWESVPIEK